MRKSTYITYEEMDVRKIVKDELEKAKPSWIEDITESVTNKVSEKIVKFKDEVMTGMDKVMKELETKYVHPTA